MNRAAKYLQRKFNIDLKEAETVVMNIRYLDKMDNGECMMYFHSMGHLVKKDDSKLADVCEEYENMINTDTGEQERLAIKNIYGE